MKNTFIFGSLLSIQILQPGNDSTTHYLKEDCHGSHSVNGLAGKGQNAKRV